MCADPGVGGRGYEVLTAEVGVDCPRPMVEVFSEEVERLNGFFNTGYSRDGIGGGSLLPLPTLKALRIDAKEGFLEKAVLVEGCAECE